MSDSESTSPETSAIREAIQLFLQERLQPKLDKLPHEDTEGRDTLIESYKSTNWIADAAKRVSQIQQVTHPIKFSHPAATGSSINSTGNPDSDPLDTGSHDLGTQAIQDVVGNAAALDVYKFLRLTIAGRSLLERITLRDPALIKALHHDEKIALEWIESFSRLSEQKGQVSSHKLAKQVYWPVAHGEYHLLAPLLASPLSQAIHERITKDRFSSEAKAARAARHSGQPHTHGYRDYPNLVIQNLGGSKPQNISQLNSERHGENLLLASLPPRWKSVSFAPPMNTDSVFVGYYPYRREVRRLVKILKEYLHNIAGRRSTLHIRYTRASLVAELIDELLNMAAELHSGLEPGWSAQPGCRLRLPEQRWLDPGRCEIDQSFAEHFTNENWQSDICKHFANWLNSALQTDRVLLGEIESAEWVATLKKEMNLLREEIQHG